ncbi:hypothetical protein J1614_012279 [Plenodomus biglobosus]|nr:hypothetical protein J1614_012279 [Plenodomus biglobosus]
MVKKGWPVLVYAGPDVGPKAPLVKPEPCECTFRSSSKLGQATMCLRFPAHITGDVNDQGLFFQYDANLLVPGTTSLGPAKIPLPTERLNMIIRSPNKTQVQTLSICLRRPCPIWYPPSPCSPSQQVVRLGKATKIHILFDYHWVHEALRPIFQRFAEQDMKLSGFPVHLHYAKTHEVADWTKFQPEEVTQSPPPYAPTSYKRCRESESPVLYFPPSKRMSKPPSPTECATPSATDELSSQALLDNPLALNTQSTVINRAVADLLPSALEQLLSKLLPTLSTTGPDPLCPGSAPSSKPQIAVPLSQQTDTNMSLAAAFHLFVQSYLTSVLDTADDNAAALRETADAEFIECFEDAKIDLIGIKEDSLQELQMEETAVLERIKDNFGEVLEDTERITNELGILGEHTFQVAKERLREVTDTFALTYGFWSIKFGSVFALTPPLILILSLIRFVAPG